MEYVNRTESSRYGLCGGDARVFVWSEERGSILIVDDDIEMLGVLHAFLEEKGFTVSGSLSANKAMELLRYESFDLLIADLYMPEMDGIDLLQAAFRIDPDLVGIIMTGYGSVETAVEAMKAGAFDYLLKPFQFSVLMPVCLRALWVRRLSRSERQYRALVDDLKLAAKKGEHTRKIPDINCETADLKDEIERLNAELMTYKSRENHWMFYDA